MSQANEIETVESTPQSNLRREVGATAAVDTRGSRVLLRIPDCTARLSTVSGEGVRWWTRLQSISELAGPWLDVVRPVVPPRVLAASVIGILLGFVMIMLTPSEKPIPSFRSQRDQAATGQRALAPPPADTTSGPLPSVGTTETESAAQMAARPKPPVAVDGPQPDHVNVFRTEPAPAPTGARLTGAIHQ